MVLNWFSLGFKTRYFVLVGRHAILYLLGLGVKTTKNLWMIWDFVKVWYPTTCCPHFVDTPRIFIIEGGGGEG